MICSLLRNVSRASVKLQKKEIIIYKSHDECRVCQKTKFCWKWNSSFHFRFDQLCLVWQRRLLHHHVNKLFVTWIDLMSHKKMIAINRTWYHKRSKLNGIYEGLVAHCRKWKKTNVAIETRTEQKLATERDRTCSTIGADNEADRH